MFIVTEIQVDQNGNVSTLNDNYTDLLAAYNKYHTVLAYAALSDVDRHAAYIYNEDGIVARECFNIDGASSQEVFIVLEVQIGENGSFNIIDASFTDPKLAWSRYYTILASAIVSNVYKHAAYIITPNEFIAHECFMHAQEQEEPVIPISEPVEEPQGESGE